MNSFAIKIATAYAFKLPLLATVLLHISFPFHCPALNDVGQSENSDGWARVLEEDGAVL